MKISLSPMRRDDTLSVVKQGDTLTINGDEFDLSVVGEGDLLPREAIDSEWFASDVERIDGALHLTLVLPHGPDASEAVRFPSPLVNPPDGPLELPQ